MKILVCTDGSRPAKEAIIFFSDLVRVFDHKITILSVKTAGVDTKEALRESKRFFSEKGIKVETKEREGNVADEILNESIEGRYDLIVMGSRGLSLHKTFFGSISHRVVEHAKIPVLIV